MATMLQHARARGLRLYRHTLRGRPTKDRILHELKAIFVHVPKTGGNSVTTALNSVPRRSTGPIYPELFKHSKAFDIRQAVGEEIWAHYFSFAFVRNPWDLMVSSYHWWLQKAPRWRKFDADVDRIRQMRDFTTFMLSPYGRTMINRREGSLFDWIGHDGQVIVDYVGKMETMADDWRAICDRLELDVELPHLNQTEREPDRDYYNDETRQIVERRFARIIDLCGYEF